MIEGVLRLLLGGSAVVRAFHKERLSLLRDALRFFSAAVLFVISKDRGNRRNERNCVGFFQGQLLKRHAD